MIRLGAHQSISKGYIEALNTVRNIGGNCLQIFSSSPRTWQSAQVSQETIREFNKKEKELDIGPVFFHACYLINLADNAYTGEKSIQSLTEELVLASQMGVIGSIVHPGSFKSTVKKAYDFKQVNGSAYTIFLKNIEKVLKATPTSTLVILENSGTRKIGSTTDELAKIISDLKDPRVQVCLDTCHLHAAGYDLTHTDKLDAFLDNFESEIGIQNLAVIHANDSRDTLASFRDRHENIGQGLVGLSVFENLLNHPALKEKPFIIETPGFDGNGPDRKNIEILKNMTE